MRVDRQPLFKRPELLLHPNIPKPLHGCAPRVILGAQWWDEERHKAKAANNNCCWACGTHEKEIDCISKQRLEGHEAYHIDYPKGLVTLEEIVSLCHLCHNFIHDGRLEMMVRDGKETQAFYDFVVSRGVKLTAGLSLPKPPKRMAPWASWRLRLNGTDYGPSTANEREWEEGKWMGWKPPHLARKGSHKNRGKHDY